MHNILLIDKGDSSLHNFKRSLAKGYSLFHEQTVSSSLKHLRENTIDLIVIDSLFSSGIIRSAKFNKLSEGIPRLIMTDGHTDKEIEHLMKDTYTLSVEAPFTYKTFDALAEKLMRIKALANDSISLRQEQKTRKDENTFFNTISDVFSAQVELDKDLSSIMEQLKYLTGSAAWSLLLSDEPVFDIIPLKLSKKIRKIQLNKNNGIAGWVMDNRTPLNIENIVKDKRFEKKADGFPNLTPGPLLCVPLKVRGRMGALRLARKIRQAPYSTRDMELAVNTSSFAAMAIERAYLSNKIKHDELTNLFNSSHMKETIESEIQRSQRYGSHFSIVFMDIDDFKRVNDRFGHLVGSRILIEIASILQKNLRSVDILARYGGDEYVIVLPQTSRKASFIIAERLRRTIEKNIFLKDNGYTVRLTASFGVASYPEDANTKDDLLKLADDAMYHGKFLTKNMVYSAK